MTRVCGGISDLIIVIQVTIANSRLLRRHLIQRKTEYFRPKISCRIVFNAVDSYTRTFFGGQIF